MNQINKNSHSIIFLALMFICLCCLLTACSSNEDGIVSENSITKVISPEIPPIEMPLTEMPISTENPSIKPAETAIITDKDSSTESTPAPTAKTKVKDTNNEKVKTTIIAKPKETSVLDGKLFGRTLQCVFYLCSNNTIYYMSDGSNKTIIPAIYYEEYLYFANDSEIYRVKPDGTGFCCELTEYSLVNLVADSQSAHTLTLVKIEGGIIYYTDTLKGVVSNQQFEIHEDKYIGSDAYYNFYLRGNDQVYSVHWNKSIADNSAMVYDGYLYFDTTSGIDRVKQDGTGFKQLWSNPMADEIMHGWGTSITKIENGIVYVTITSSTGELFIRLRIADTALCNVDIPEKPFGISTDGYEYYLDSSNQICVLDEGAFWDVDVIGYEGYLYFHKVSCICKAKVDGTEFEEIYTPIAGVVNVAISKIEKGILYFVKYLKYGTPEQCEIKLS